MSPRKRRREEAFPEEEEISQHNGALEDAAVDEKERSEKEQEVWDAIREIHYEALVQYISTRQAIANGSFESGEKATTAMAVGDKDGTACNGKPTGPPNFALATPLTRLRSGDGQSSAGPFIPLPMPPDRQNPPQTTIELLSYLAWMSEELIRASQEKVNLARANHDSVERHIQLLDQAIKEQEASLSQDSSRGNNGTSIRLPEVVAPQLPNRNGRPAQSSSDDDPPVATEIPPSVPEAAKSSQRGSRKKGKVPADKQKPDKEESGKDSASLTITLPATQPSEELYCYCNRISFGEMIACDNESCEKEWFHYGCVGLTEPPEGEWFCEDCRVDEA
ncbi:unnamed protein product [Cyclocybe aegerita]|uniref:PHD-type domain-containing protein n=1 Tax=Cyclocybe aegerita TaxID=1973307 RepID=A0A8S0VT05_CYCAE|nr:unnamed protein product [Cyclocybe aegerita]